MFAKTIIDSDAFLDMPLSAQALYFHLSMRADDDGFINNPKKIQRMIGASDDDCKLLIMKQFIIPFESGIVVIKHWRIHNYIRSDRKKNTNYIEEMASLTEKENGEYRGTDFLMDKCPIPGNFLETTKDDDEEKEIKEKGQHYYYNSCRYGVRKNIELESIGENSSCFNGRYKKKKDSIALCLEYHCNGETKNYSVIIKGKEYRCNSKTDVISIKSENQEIHQCGR